PTLDYATPPRAQPLTGDPLTLLAVMSSLATLTKAALVFDGILADEKPVLVGLFVFTTATGIWSLIAARRRRSRGRTAASLLAFAFLITSVWAAAHGWR